MKGRVTPFKPTTYRLANNRVGNSTTFKSGRKGNLIIYDEAKKQNRAIRHCPNEKSIFVDEQSDLALATPVIFEHGILEIDRPTKNITKDFLDAHPHNVENQGTWFYKVDEEADTKEAIDLEDSKIELKYLIKKKANEKKGLYALQAEVSVIEGRPILGSDLSIDELKAILYDRVDSDPKYFLDDHRNPIIFEDSSVFTKYIVLQNIKSGVILKDNTTRNVFWADNREVIYTAPRGVDIVDSFSEYLTTEEGILVAQEMNKRS